MRDLNAEWNGGEGGPGGDMDFLDAGLDSVTCISSSRFLGAELRNRLLIPSFLIVAQEALSSEPVMQ